MNQIQISQSSEHAGKPLTLKIARALLIEMFSGKTGVQKKELKRAVDEMHTKRGGSLSTNEMHPVSAALSVMKKQGLANNPSRGEWSIFSTPSVHSKNLFDSDAVRTLGKGKNSVYLWYYPAYRYLAEYEGKEFWACKISSVETQVPTEMPELPEIRLILRTDDPENLEQILHNILMFRGKQIADAPGKEWFMTSPSGVEDIYKMIMENAA